VSFFEDLHLYVGYAVPAGFVLLVLWAAVTFLRNRPPHDAFWNLLAVLQVVVVIQFVVGVILFLSGGRPQWRHYMYGAVIPALALIVAHRQARRLPDVAPLIFGIAGFFCAASTAMALMTGLGIF
jgi:hypothetical protein